MEFLLIPLLVAATSLATFFICRYHSSKKNFKSLEDKSLIQQVQIDHLQIYKTIVQHSPDLFVIVDQSMQIVVVNKTALDYGWSGSQSFSHANISETSKIHFEFELRQVLDKGIVKEGEIRLVQSQNHSWRYYRYHIFPVRDEEGAVTAATISALDVTAQREAENKLNDQREFMESIMNAIPDILYVKDDHQCYLYGNDLFSKIIGKESGSYTGLRDDDIFPPDTPKTWAQNDRRVLRTSEAQEIEEEIIDASGKKRVMHSKRVPFRFQDGRTVLISVMRDFSEKKLLENELQVSRARQEEASRLATLGETASGIAHQINNPLNVLVGVAELMKIKTEKDGFIEREKLEDYCDRIIKHSMRIAKIIKGLRSISRDASHDPMSEVSLKMLVDETLELCHQQFHHRGIAIDLKLPQEDILVEGRAAQLSQILLNLMNNARDAVEGDSQPTVHVQLLTEEGQGIIRVWDSGPGVPADLEKKIMNPFFTTKPAGKGTGLGLSISKAIATEHKGDLILNRKIAPSCFDLKIPLITEENRQIA